MGEMKTDESTKVCPSCGYQLAVDASMCVHCAYDFESVPFPSAFAPRLNAFAIASLALAVLWLGGLGSIAAIFLGRLALYRIASSRDRETGRVVALAGIVLGGVGIVVTAIGVLFFR